MKVALITGCYGQDGINLISYLDTLDYSVIGLVKERNKKLDSLLGTKNRKLVILETDLSDKQKVSELISKFSPNEIYNLAGMSIPSHCDLNPKEAVNTNIGIPINLLEELKTTEIRLFQASSSEIFGNCLEPIQNEETKISPRNIYGMTKAAAHFAVGNYRLNYGVLAGSGIMYNHESEFRDKRIVTTKIVENLLRIKYSNDKSKFKLGNINAMRDWGYSGDFVKAMWMVLQQPKLDDFVISTNKLHSVKDFLLLAMLSLDMGEDMYRYVEIDESLLRKSDFGILQGDYSKINRLLGWKPTLNLEQIIDRMIKFKYNTMHE